MEAVNHDVGMNRVEKLAKMISLQHTIVLRTLLVGGEDSSILKKCVI